jgi:hypothetical protein
LRGCFPLSGWPRALRGRLLGVAARRSGLSGLAWWFRRQAGAVAGVACFRAQKNPLAGGCSVSGLSGMLLAALALALQQFEVFLLKALVQVALIVGRHLFLDFLQTTSMPALRIAAGECRVTEALAPHVGRP